MSTSEQQKPSYDDVQIRRAFWAAVITAGTGLLFFGFALFSVIRTANQWAYWLIGMSLIQVITGVIAIPILRRGNLVFGVGLSLAASWTPPILATLLIANAGPITLAFIAFSGMIIIAWVMPAQGQRWAMVVGGVILLLVSIIEWVWNPAFRFVTPELLNFAPYATGAMVLGFAVILVRQAWAGSLQLKLLVSLLVVVLITLAAVTFAVNNSVQTALTNQLGENFAAFASDQLESIDSFFLEKAGQLQVLSTVHVLIETSEERNATYTGRQDEIISQIEDLDEAWIAAPDNDPFILGIITPELTVNPAAEALADFLADFSDHSELIFTDRYGANIATTGRTSDYYQGDEEWWQVAWNDGQGAIYISEPEYDESAGVNAILIAVPVLSEETNEPIGVLRSTLNVDSLYANIAATTVGETGHAVLFNNQGEVLFDPYADTEESAALPEDLRMNIVSDVRQFDVVTDQHGHEILIGHASYQPEGETTHAHAAYLSEKGEQIVDTVKELGWGVLIRQDAEEAFVSVESITRTILVISVVAIAVAGLVALGLARLIANPIVRLSQAADQMGSGNLDVTLPEAGGDEVGTLTTSLASMANRLGDLIGTLEQRVAVRTRALQTSTEVSRRLSTILDQDQLLREVVEQLQSAFGFYHAHIYLYDQAHQNLVMAGGTGDAGRTMLARGHKIEKGRGLVGRAAETNAPVLVPDVSQEPGWLPNPLLPETKAEVAVPIAIGPDVLGVLDVQHNVTDGLTEADADLVQAIGNQVAIAVQNAQAYTRAQYQADYEARIAAISQRVQAATTIEDVLKVAVSELGQALGAKQSSVELSALRTADRQN